MSTLQVDRTWSTDLPILHYGDSSEVVRGMRALWARGPNNAKEIRPVRCGGLNAPETANASICYTYPRKAGHSLPLARGPSQALSGPPNPLTPHVSESSRRVSGLETSFRAEARRRRDAESEPRSAV